MGGGLLTYVQTHTYRHIYAMNEMDGWMDDGLIHTHTRQTDAFTHFGGTRLLSLNQSPQTVVTMTHTPIISTLYMVGGSQ